MYSINKRSNKKSIKHIGIDEITIKSIIFIAICFLIAAIALPPGIISQASQYSAINRAENYLAIGSTFVILLYIVYRRLIVSIYHLATYMTFIGLVAVITFANYSLYKQIDYTLILVFFRVSLIYGCFVVLLASNKAKLFSLSVTIYSIVILCANLYSIIVYPNGIIMKYSLGWNPYYVLNNSNSFAPYHIFYFSLAVINAGLWNGRWRILIGLIIILEALSLFALNANYFSTTAFLILIIMLILLCFKALQKSFLQTKTMVAVVLFSLLFIVILDNGRDALFSLLSLFGLDTSTLESRLYIWSNALGSSYTHPIFGSGSVVGDFTVDYYGLPRNAHNTYLQIFYYGGTVGLALFIILFAIALRSKLDITDCVDIGVRIGVLAFLVAFFIEAKPYCSEYYSLVLLASAYYSHRFCIQKAGCGRV